MWRLISAANSPSFLVHSGLSHRQFLLSSALVNFLILLLSLNVTLKEATCDLPVPLLPKPHPSLAWVPSYIPS